MDSAERMEMDYCTYFDATYLSKGLALYQSMQAHCQPFHLYVLALCDRTVAELRKRNLENVTIVPLADFETDALRVVRPQRTWTEYIWTMTPHWMLYLFSREPLSSMSYIDADCYFFGDPHCVFDEIGNASLGITPHRFPPRLKHFEANGLFNVGLVYARRDDDAMACLREWSSQTLDWCYKRNENGKFADQKYLDAWPERWGAYPIKQNGGNLAPWNQEQYDYGLAGSTILVNGDPLIWYHFHNGLDPHYPIKPFVAEYIYKPYAKALQKIESQLKG